MKTYSAKASDIKRKWYVLDASEVPLGRLSTAAAGLLIGKGKPSLTPHMDGGDYVVVVNAKKMVVTGNKTATKKYYRHSGYPGGLYQRTLAEQNELDPTKAIQIAIRGMLPVNKLRPNRLLRLKIYPDSQHNHSGQAPKMHSFKKPKGAK